MIVYSCIDFKYHSTYFCQFPFHRCHSIHMINLLKRSPKFLYGAKYSTSIMMLRHKRMIIEFRIRATIRSLVVKIESWLSLYFSVSFWREDELNLWKVLYLSVSLDIIGVVLSAITFVKKFLSTRLRIKSDFRHIEANSLIDYMHIPKYQTISYLPFQDTLKLSFMFQF